MSRPTQPTYNTTNWPAYNEALKRRGALTIWFGPEMSWDAVPTGRRGRQQTFSDTTIQTCLTMKVLFGMALRQTTGFVESLLRLVGLNWQVPDFSTQSCRQQTLAVTIPYRGAKGPLLLLIDSTGVKVEGEGAWHARKHDGPKRRVWRKIHLGDAPVLPDLLSRIPIGDEINDSRHSALRAHGPLFMRVGGPHLNVAMLEFPRCGQNGPRCQNLEKKNV